MNNISFLCLSIIMGLISSGYQNAVANVEQHIEGQLVAEEEMQVLTLIDSYLTDIQQTHLLEGLRDLSLKEKIQFWEQIKKHQRPLVEQVVITQKPPVSFEPVQQVALAGSEQDRQAGQRAIAQGKMACLILAGGQGSRLGGSAPKGTVIVSEKEQKSLFQIFCEKILQRSVEVGSPLHLAIMTSPLNHQQTLNFFEAHDYFGLPRDYVAFFEQSMLPFSDEQNNWVLQKPGKLAEGPNGNGYALHLLYQTGIVDKWRDSGVEYVNVLPVDNALADPFDAELIGYQMRTEKEVIIKAVRRASADEKMGVIVQDHDRLRVVEYSEIPAPEFQALNPDGSIRLSIANTGLLSFNINFIQKMATDSTIQMPLHKAIKQVSVDKGTVSICKYEAFLFDLLNYTDSIGLLLYPRDQIFAPLKTPADLEKLSTLL